MAKRSRNLQEICPPGSPHVPKPSQHGERIFPLILTAARKQLKKRLATRWIRFGIVGALATVTYYALGILLVTIMGLPLLVGNAAAYALSFIVSYLGQCLWTFEGGHNHFSALPKFAATQLVGLGINSIVVEFCVRLGLIYPVSMVIASLVAPVFVFFICKYWVFRKKSPEASEPRNSD